MIRRFLFSASANLFRSFLAFITGVLLARWLGPSTYGDMAFLLGTFLGIRQLLDLGASSAFFTFLSQRPRSWKFVKRFIYWMALQFSLPILVILFIFPNHWVSAIWQDRNLFLVILAFAASFSQGTLWQVAQQLAESSRKTIFVQNLGMLAAAVHLCAVIMFMTIGIDGLYPIFIALFIEYLVVFYLVVLNYYRDDCSNFHHLSLQHQNEEPSFKSYLIYCLPLLPSFFFGAVQEIFDRWLLQYYGGATEQGYYAFGYQIAGAAALFINAIVRVLWKEVAEAHHLEAKERMIEMFKRVLRVTRFIAGVGAGFIAVYAGDLVRTVGGDAYKDSATTMSILAIYIGYMTIAQIYSTFLMATGKVKAIGYLGPVVSLVSISFAYILLATQAGHLNEGVGAARNIAIKMAVVEYLVAFAYGRIIYRAWNIKSESFMQLWCLIFGIFVALVAREVSIVFISTSHSIILLIVGMPLFLILISISIYAYPRLFGFSKEDLRRLLLNN